MKILYPIFVAMVMLMLAGCEQYLNEPPVIEEIVLSKTEAEPGEEIVINVLASDPDGDGLKYEYQVSAGAISGTGNMVKWTAPNTAGPYFINITVSDRYNEVRRSTIINPGAGQGLVIIVSNWPLPREASSYTFKLNGVELFQVNRYKDLAGLHKFSSPISVGPGNHRLEITCDGAYFDVPLKAPENQVPSQVTSILIIDKTIVPAAPQNLTAVRQVTKAAPQQDKEEQAKALEKEAEELEKQAGELEKRADEEEKKAAEYEKEAKDLADKARKLLEGTQKIEPHWWEALIPGWNLEVIIAGSWSLLSYATVNEMYHKSNSLLDLARASRNLAASLKEQAAQKREEAKRKREEADKIRKDP